MSASLTPLKTLRSQRGSALIIALAFIVILTGVMIGFFSRAMIVKQSSDANLSQTKVNLFANGAVETIIADLKQEIAAGSTITSPATGVDIYVPKPSTVMPALVGSTGSGGLENLVKRSASGKPFFAGTSYSSSYEASNRASNVATTTPSQNGRYVSLARWNLPLLLPITAATATKTDYTPNVTPTLAPPDWIYVDRGGDNPKAMNGNMKIVKSVAADKVVVGRYAYMIYNEGGLLDMNVAGYPDPSSATALTGAMKDIPRYKSALAFADLLQLKDSGGTSLLGTTNSNIDQIVGWRNYATASGVGVNLSPLITGNLSTPNLSWKDATAKSNYYKAVLSNSDGFLTASKASQIGDASDPLKYAQGSDQMFATRQQMIRFFKKVLNAQGNVRLHNALNYLTHFTRDVNQPSIIKPQSMNSDLAGYDSSAPTIQTIANGGNNQATLDAYVNPAFPGVRTARAFTRNDGTRAVVGEPLVKKRFALNRLTWLTYQGPSATRIKTDRDMQELINNQGITWEFLQQGTAANIQKYFGLTWVADSGSKLGKWSYNVHNGPTGSRQKGPIMRLGAKGDSVGLANLSTPREPDFFELLKAAVNAGSKAKAATTNTGSTEAADYQAQRDNSFDYAIMQLGANIISQSRVDGFGARIAFDDGSLPAKEFYGVLNNPYLYRVRYGALKIRQEDPSPSGSALAPNTGATSATQAGGAVLKDTGVSLFMLIPEIWNPHDQNSRMPGIDLHADLAPSLFRIVADSADPDSVLNGGSYNQVGAAGSDSRGSLNSAGNPSISYPGQRSFDQSEASNTWGQPYFSRTKGSGTAGSQITDGLRSNLHPLTADTTAMTFNLPARTTFREPTILARYNVPGGSNLKIDSSRWSSSFPETQDYNAVETSTQGKSFANGHGFRADVNNPMVLSNAPAANTEYVGIPIGLLPCMWVRYRSSGEAQTSRFIARSDTVSLRANSTRNFTFRMQYQDPTNTSNWITYDMKYVKPGLDVFTHNILGTPGAGGMMQWSPSFAVFTDPRTSRFGAIAPTGWTNSAAGAGYAAPGAAQRPSSLSSYSYATSETARQNDGDWIDASNGMLISERPTSDSGRFLIGGTLANQAVGWKNPKMYLGMLSQNSMAVSINGKRYSSPFGTDSNNDNGPQYYADADAVVRRAMGAYNTSNAGTATMTGLPLAATLKPGGGVNNPSQSRPWMLHRPFHSVAELGYVFSDTPWKNIDFFAPESGDSGLLDVFCLNESSDVDALVAGKVNLNTRQAPVLKAVLSGAYRDEQNVGSSSLNTAAALDAIANALVARTTSGSGLTSVSELVGRFKGGGGSPVNGSTAYDGFSNDLSGVLSGAYGANTAMTNVDRFREAVVRPLASVGTTRTWNLLIDVVAQTGRYPQLATTLDKFVVEGEQRYWVHVAIDRVTGQVVDKQIEVVKE